MSYGVLLLSSHDMSKHFIQSQNEGWIFVLDFSQIRKAKMMHLHFSDGSELLQRMFSHCKFVSTNDPVIGQR